MMEFILKICFMLMLGHSSIQTTEGLRKVRTAETTEQVEEVERALIETTNTESLNTSCEGKGNVCVAPNQCDKGSIEGNYLDRSYNYTNECYNTDECCTIKPWDPNTAGECGVRNLNTYPQGPLQINANFAEFPWQIMVLRESTKSLLCGGIIVKKNFVLTTANCVVDQKYIDIIAKGGEWKLGSNDEGIDFMLVRLKSISIHPEYNYTKLAHNLAILHLERDFNFNVHIEPLCLDETGQDPKSEDYCVTTGWGQQALRIHEKDAIEHFTEIKIVNNEDCTRIAGADNFNPDISLCGTSLYDACAFDFGSALACEVEKDSNKFALKGVYTHNTGCNNQEPLMIFSKPDIGWINAVTATKP